MKHLVLPNDVLGYLMSYIIIVTIVINLTMLLICYRLLGISFLCTSHQYYLIFKFLLLLYLNMLLKISFCTF